MDVDLLGLRPMRTVHLRYGHDCSTAPAVVATECYALADKLDVLDVNAFHNFLMFQAIKCLPVEVFVCAGCRAEFGKKYHIPTKEDCSA